MTIYTCISVPWNKKRMFSVALSCNKNANYCILECNKQYRVAIFSSICELVAPLVKASCTSFVFVYTQKTATVVHIVSIQLQLIFRRLNSLVLFPCARIRCVSVSISSDSRGVWVSAAVFLLLCRLTLKHLHMFTFDIFYRDIHKARSLVSSALRTKAKKKTHRKQWNFSRLR